jgi:hypothetical protein
VFRSRTQKKTKPSFLVRRQRSHSPYGRFKTSLDLGTCSRNFRPRTGISGTGGYLVLGHASGPLVQAQVQHEGGVELGEAVRVDAAEVAGYAAHVDGADLFGLGLGGGR